MISKKNITICALLLTPFVTHSVEVVRLDIQIGATSNIVDLELFDSKTPNTVQNFLNYVDVTLANPRYDGSFFHRSVPGFIVQGGGFTFDSALGAFEYDSINDVFTGGLQEVPADDPVANEFQESGLSNVRGTIAMAKIAAQFVEGGDCVEEGPDCTLIAGTGADSATSEWFINLADNSANLDIQNDGFTVFGKVISDGMTVFDQIETISVFNQSIIHPAMGAIPLDNYVATSEITQANLIRLNTVRQIQRPILNTDVSSLDYGFLQLGDFSLLTVNLQNTGNADLVMDNNSIAITAPYTIESENCSNITLVASSTDNCSISLRFEPVALGIYNTQIQITPAVNPNNVTLTIDVLGTGIVGEPDIEVVTELEMGVAASGFPALNLLKVFNRGQAPLQFTAFSFSGTNATDFGLVNNCPGISTDNTLLPLEQDESCSILVEMQASTIGPISANLVLESNDPDEQLVTISLTGTGDTDIDGIAAVIEQAAPNAGDANNDTIQDDVQNNVASFLTALNRYATVVTSVDTLITEFELPVHPDIAGSPQNISFDHGLFKFILLPTSSPRDEVIQLAVLMPQGDAASTFYSYGPTADNNTPHWYDFSYDGITGAQYLGNVTVEPPGGGAKVTRSMFRVSFLDGARGDDDMAADGKISNVSAVGTVASTDSSGGLSCWFLLVSVLTLRVFRRG